MGSSNSGPNSRFVECLPILISLSFKNAKGNCFAQISLQIIRRGNTGTCTLVPNLKLHNSRIWICADTLIHHFCTWPELEYWFLTTWTTPNALPSFSFLQYLRTIPQYKHPKLIYICTYRDWAHPTYLARSAVLFKQYQWRAFCLPYNSSLSEKLLNLQVLQQTVSLWGAPAS